MALRRVNTLTYLLLGLTSFRKVGLKKMEGGSGSNLLGVLLELDMNIYLGAVLSASLTLNLMFATRSH